MATTSVRVAAKLRLFELLTAAAPPDVQVLYAFDATTIAHESIFLGGTVGAVKVRDFRSGRKARDDTFTITVHFWADMPGQETPEVADARVEELYGILEDLLATNARLANDQGPLDGVQWGAQLDGQVQFAEPAPSKEGWTGEATADVQFKTLLT